MPISYIPVRLYRLRDRRATSTDSAAGNPAAERAIQDVHNLLPRPGVSRRQSPGAGVREWEGGEAGGFGRGKAEQAQHGLGELVDGGLGNAFGVPLAHPQQPEQAAGHSAERDLGIGNGKPARGLPRLDVAQGTRRQADGDVQGVQAGAGEEPGDVRVGPAEPPGDPQAPQRTPPPGR